MPTSRDPAKRSRQLANLQPNARRTHGARSKAVGPLADVHRERLAVLLPTADPELLAIQARRCAQLELLGNWIAEHGLLRRSPKGGIYEAAQFHERLASAFERTHQAMADRERGSGDPAAALAAHLAEIGAGDG